MMFRMAPISGLMVVRNPSLILMLMLLGLVLLFILRLSSLLIIFGVMLKILMIQMRAALTSFREFLAQFTLFRELRIGVLFLLYKRGIVKARAPSFRLIDDHAALPGSPNFQDNAWCTLESLLITQDHVAAWPDSVDILFVFASFFGLSLATGYFRFRKVWHFLC